MRSNIVKVLPLGTIVRMDESSVFYDQCLNSLEEPTIGVIIDYEDVSINGDEDRTHEYAPGMEVKVYDFIYKVRWDNGHINSYMPQDIHIHTNPKNNGEALKFLKKASDLL